MEDIISKSLVGTGGFFASLGLAQFSEVVSVIVGLATLTYMVLNIYKIIKEDE
jgi:uncharacterized membrane protein (Fun14 family)